MNTSDHDIPTADNARPDQPIWEPPDSPWMDDATERRAWHQNLQEAALEQNGGGRGFKHWKAKALQKIIELADASPRMQIGSVDLRNDLVLMYRIRQPVPRFPQEGKLTVGDSVTYHLVYTEAWRHSPPPPWGPVGVLAPPDIWHPNTRPALRSALCFGEIPPSIEPCELICLGYFLTTLQAYQLDEQDPHGVFNAAASEFYRGKPEYLPLTDKGLFDDWKMEDSHR